MVRGKHMESALGWIGEIFRYIGAFIPRPFLVTAIEGGVKFKRGKEAVRLWPGFGIYWPLFSKIKIVPVVYQPATFPGTALITKDGRSISMSVMALYKIIDPVKALTETEDIFATILMAGQTAIPSAVLGKTLAELLRAIQNDNDEGLNGELAKRLKEVLEPFGIEINYCRVCDCVKTFPIHLFNEGGYMMPTSSRTE